MQAIKIQLSTFKIASASTVNLTKWNKQALGDQESFTYDVVEVPVVEGFYADKRQAGGLEVRPDLPEVEDTVTYTELGKIIPVDEYGTPIENAPTPSYNNDPEDPTMAMETVVPDVLGYISEKTFITPEHPGQDTNVVYAKDEQKAIILT